MFCMAACGPVLLRLPLLVKWSKPKVGKSSCIREQDLSAIFPVLEHFLVSTFGCTPALPLNLIPQLELSNKNVVGQVDVCSKSKSAA